MHRFAIGIRDERRRKATVHVVVRLQRDPNLLQVIDTTCAIGGLLRRSHSRQQNPEDKPAPNAAQKDEKE